MGRKTILTKEVNWPVKQGIAAKRMRQCDVARAAGLTPLRLGQFVNGYTNLGREALERLAAVLGVDPDSIAQKRGATDGDR